jgi:copper chaperone CopZ
MPIIKIKGMSCGHCVASVKEALENVPGTQDVAVDLKKEEARFNGYADPEAVKEAIAKIGFEVVPDE